MWNVELNESQARIKIARRNNNFRYTEDTTIMAESKEELKSFLMKVKEESEKVSLKLNIQKTKIMASIPITSRHIDGEKVETVADFIFLGSKITVDSDCSHEIETCLLLARKGMTKLDSMLKSRAITLLSKVHTESKLWFSSTHVWMWESEHKEGECWRNDAFELDWVRLLRVHWKARKSNQSILNGIFQPWIFTGRTDAEAPLLWPPDAKSRLIGIDPDAGKGWRPFGEGSGRGWDGWIASQTQWTWIWVNYGRWWRTRKPGVL